MQSLFTGETFVYCALLFYVLGFMFRDELWLRVLLLIGTTFYILYYRFAAESPLWDGIYTSSILIAVNFFMICVIIIERSKFTMSSDMVSLYAHFPNLSPGQFKRLMKKGEMVVANEPTTLAEEGKTLSNLYYIFDGDVTLIKAGQRSEIPSGHFVGEVTFLRGGEATATVEVGTGAQYMIWPHDGLKATFEKAPNLSNAMLARFNLDLVGKLAKSQPVKA